MLAEVTVKVPPLVTIPLMLTTVFNAAPAPLIVIVLPAARVPSISSVPAAVGASTVMVPPPTGLVDTVAL